MKKNEKCYARKIYEKDFCDKESKKAYLNACIWLAKNIYGKKGINDYILTKIEKQKTQKNKPFVFKVIIYILIDSNEMESEFCNKCRQLHSIFYCVDKINCSECEMFAYKSNLDKKLIGIENFISENIKENELWEEAENE